MADLDVDLFQAPFDRELMRRVTGCEPSNAGHVDIDGGTGIRLVKRLTIRDAGGGGVAILTWPAELKDQAIFLYSEGRGERVLAAAAMGGWETLARPHLSYFNAAARQRFYMTPRLSAREYVAQWSDDDVDRVGGGTLEEITAMWPWLLDRRYASESDRPEFEAFLDRLERSNRQGHLRPGLRLKREWPKAEVEEMRGAGRVEEVLRQSIDRLLEAAGDPRLPASR